MEMVEKCFNFLKDGSLEKVGLSSWPKFPVGKEIYFDPDIFQVARECLQQAGNIQY